MFLRLLNERLQLHADDGSVSELTLADKINFVEFIREEFFLYPDWHELVSDRRIFNAIYRALDRDGYQGARGFQFDFVFNPNGTLLEINSNYPLQNFVLQDPKITGRQITTASRPRLKNLSAQL